MKLRTAVSVLVLPFLIAGCGRDAVNTGGEELTQLEVADELRIGSRDDPQYSFGWFRSLAVGPEGTFYIPMTKSCASTTIPVASSNVPRPTGLLPDGTMSATSAAWAQLVAGGEITEQVVLRWTRDGALIDTLAVRPVENTAWEVRRPNGTFRSYSRQPFTDVPLVEWSPSRPEFVRVDRSVGARGGEQIFRVTKTEFAGDTVFNWTLAYVPIPFTDALIYSVVASRAAGIAERSGFTAGQIADRSRASLYFPPHVRPVATLTFEMDRSVWLERTDDGTEPVRWLRLATDGSVSGEVRAPREFRLLAATANRWWGSASDETDTPFIVRYDIVSTTLHEDVYDAR